MNRWELAFYYIGRPFSYLFISHKDKVIYDWYIPAIISVAMLLIGIVTVPAANFFGAGGLADKLLSVFQNMPGFYLAGLTIAATFARDSIDQPMSGIAPKLKVLLNGRITEISVTRRRFLCALFSYLAATSLVYCVLLGVSVSVVAEAKEFLGAVTLLGISLISKAIIVFVLVQITVITFFGMYYLAEKIHEA